MHGEGGPGSLGDEQQQVTPQQEQLIKQGTYVAHVSPPSMHRLNAVKTCTEGTKFDSDRYVACMLKEGEKILKRLLQVHLTVQRLPCRQCGRTLISAEPMLRRVVRGATDLAFDCCSAEWPPPSNC